MALVGEAADGEAALRLTEETHPDVVVMDISMPGLGGLDGIRRIKDSVPDTQVVVLTMHEDEHYFFQALEAGASGYVIKGAAPVELLSAIRAVRGGQAYFCPSLAKQMLNDYLRRADAGSEKEKDTLTKLSDREKEVLKLIAEGKTGREIASQLFLSPNTVERHRANIMDKLGLHNRAELIKFAIRKGLVPLED
ncbi:MAG: response regulator transcription factor [Chloroflexota bacterium]|nr:response regulator transcription factor [Chloroflexota bacterium]